MSQFAGSHLFAGCAPLDAARLDTAAALDTAAGANYFGRMTEDPEDTGGAREEDGPDPNKDDAEMDDAANDDAANVSPAGGLSSKLDPDFIPQQGDTPEVERSREHPEETGS
ncbi:MAG: hypothetical protein QOH40_1492 [Arthrobacter pascens]|nr:hypothetical protein [Arthrobacter pascens]